MKPVGTGAILSPVDIRDYKYVSATLPETLPLLYHTDTSMFPVLMQAHTEACVSHTVVRLMQLWWYKKTGKIVNFSPRFLHAVTSKGMKADDGRDPRVVFEAARLIGCCTEALLPNDTTLDDATYSFVPITQAMRDEAALYKIPAYSFPNINQYEIRHAIYHKGGVALCFLIGDEWWTAPSGQSSWNPADINPLRPPQVPVGGHEVAGIGWKGV